MGTGSFARAGIPTNDERDDSGVQAGDVRVKNHQTRPGLHDSEQQQGQGRDL